MTTEEQELLERGNARLPQILGPNGGIKADAAEKGPRKIRSDKGKPKPKKEPEVGLMTESQVSELRSLINSYHLKWVDEAKAMEARKAAEDKLKDYVDSLQAK